MYTKKVYKPKNSKTRIGNLKKTEQAENTSSDRKRRLQWWLFEDT